MMYDYEGQQVKISDDELNRSMKAYHLTKEEAIEMWLEDEGYIKNPEQEELMKVGIKLVAESEPKPAKKKSARKDDMDKPYIIEFLKNALSDGSLGEFSNIEITNATKTIEFTYNGATYKLDLSKRRAKK